MEGSNVRLRIEEKEARLKKMAAAKEYKRPVNGITNIKDGKYYLVRLGMEIDKLKSLIDESEKDNKLGQLPEEASGKIRNAIGKAHLLINKRFKQFEELCRDNIENNPDKKETKPSDLQGYWEMMNIQIEDVNSLFKDIDTIRANNWKIPENNDSIDGHLNGKNGSRKSVTPRGKSTKSSKSPRLKQSNVDEEKVKKEARSRLAAARKQAKLRQKQLREEEEEANKISPDNSLNSSFDSSLNVSYDVINCSPDSQSPAQTEEASNNIGSECEIQMNGNINGHENICNGDTEVTDEALAKKAQEITLNGNLEEIRANGETTIST